MVNMTKFDDVRLFELASDTLRVSVMELGATVTEISPIYSMPNIRIRTAFATPIITLSRRLQEI